MKNLSFETVKNHNPLKPMALRYKRLYRHVRMREVAAKILRCTRKPNRNAYKIRVEWWNIGGCHLPHSMRFRDTIYVPADKLHEWLPMGYFEYGPGPRRDFL